MATKHPAVERFDPISLAEFNAALTLNLPTKDMEALVEMLIGDSVMRAEKLKD